MNLSTHTWLAAVLIAWSLVCLVLLGAMLRMIVVDRAVVPAVPATCRTHALAEATWTVPGIVLVVLTLLLAIR